MKGCKRGGVGCGLVEPGLRTMRSSEMQVPDPGLIHHPCHPKRHKARKQEARRRPEQTRGTLSVHSVSIAHVCKCRHGARRTLGQVRYLFPPLPASKKPIFRPTTPLLSVSLALPFSFPLLLSLSPLYKSPGIRAHMHPLASPHPSSLRSTAAL